MKCLDKKRIKMKQGETLALNERIMLSLVSTGVRLLLSSGRDDLQQDCPFIVCMTYAFQSPDKLCFILDLMNGGDLHYHLSQHGVFTESEMLFYASEVHLPFPWALCQMNYSPIVMLHSETERTAAGHPRFGAHAQPLRGVQRPEAGEHPSGRERPRACLRSRSCLRLLEEEASRLRVSPSLALGRPKTPPQCVNFTFPLLLLRGDSEKAV